MNLVVLLVAAYIIGSVPFGLIIGKLFYKTDLTEQGSKNIGASNAFRLLGFKVGMVVLLADLFKGFIAVYIAKFIVAPDILVIAEIFAAGATITGHSMSIFLKFSGGKGVSTTAGAMLAMMPWVFVALAAIWVSLTFLTRYVSIASLIAAMAFPFLTYFLDGNIYRILLSLMISIAVIIKHRSNIVRLIKGTENKLTFDKARQAKE